MRRKVRASATYPLRSSRFGAPDGGVAVPFLMRALGAVVSVYMLMAFARVMLGWLDGHAMGRPYELLCAAVDPYLDWFRRFPALRRGAFDFSPVAALAVLALAGNVFSTIGYLGRITVGILLSLVLRGAWSAVAFVFVFLAVALLLRWVSVSSRMDQALPLWRFIDTATKPALFRINRIFFRDRIVGFRTSLLVGAAAAIGVRVAGGLLVWQLASALERLPF